MNDEAIVLVRTSLDALVDAAEVFPSIIKTDLHACIIHIFATILATPDCQELIVPQSLAILKRFVGGMPKSADDHSSGQVQLQGCLRRFLSIYLHAQKREQPTSLACVKNCLLATTILFTSGKNQLPATDPLVARYLDEVLDCLTDRMVSTPDAAGYSGGCLLTITRRIDREDCSQLHPLAPSAAETYCSRLEHCTVPVSSPDCVRDQCGTRGSGASSGPARSHPVPVRGDSAGGPEVGVDGPGHSDTHGSGHGRGRRSVSRNECKAVGAGGG